MKMSKLLSLVVALFLLVLVNTNVTAGVVYLDQSAAIGRGWMQVQKDLKSWGLSAGERALKPFAVPLYLCFKAGEKQLVTLKTGSPEDCRPFIAETLRVNNLSTDRGLTLEEFRNRISDGLVLPTDEWLVVQEPSQAVQGESEAVVAGTEMKPVVADTYQRRDLKMVDDELAKFKTQTKTDLDRLREALKTKVDEVGTQASAAAIAAKNAQGTANSAVTAAGNAATAAATAQTTADAAQANINALSETVSSQETNILNAVDTKLGGFATKEDLSQVYTDVERDYTLLFGGGAIAVLILFVGTWIVVGFMGSRRTYEVRRLNESHKGLAVNHNELYDQVNGTKDDPSTGLLHRVDRAEAVAHKAAEDARQALQVNFGEWVLQDLFPSEAELTDLDRPEFQFNFTHLETGERCNLVLHRDDGGMFRVEGILDQRNLVKPNKGNILRLFKNAFESNRAIGVKSGVEELGREAA